jgi:ABC-type transport system involved in cytochrome c biogenesis ATPase subunit
LKPNAPLIQIENLTRCYGPRPAVERISLSVPEGALFGFLGPNGAGKTTTIRVLLGFLRPTSGTASIFGLDCWRDSKSVKRETGYLPGDLRLPGWMNGATALSIFGAVRGQDLNVSGCELAERFDLDLRVKVREMSRGMRKNSGLSWPWRTNRDCSCWMSRPARWIRSCKRPSTRSCASSPLRAIQSFSPAIRWVKSNSCVNEWLSCAKGKSLPTNPWNCFVIEPATT